MTDVTTEIRYTGETIKAEEHAPIAAIVAELERSLDRAASALSRVEDRLDIVLRPVGPTRTDEVAVAPTHPGDSQLAGILANYDVQLGHLTDRLMRLSDRVEL